ncbi:MAG: GNAT family N-acetyltransferase [Lachnospiraceae bacterium]|nr:GNAT family N-acetyltransferase [Lachnospiraceae bacterium]
MIIEQYSAVMKDGKTYYFKSLDAEEAQMMYELRLRTAGETDFLTRFPEEFPQNCEKEAAVIQATAESSRDFFLGAYDGEQIIGCAHVFPISKYKKFAHRCEIGVLLAKDYWSCGIAKRLMIDSMKQAAKMGYKIMQLGTFLQNERGIGLYEHLGFTRVGTIPYGALCKDGIYYDEVMMYKEL